MALHRRPTPETPNAQGSAAGGRTTTHLRVADGVGATPFPTRRLQPLVRLGVQPPLLGNPWGAYAKGSYL
jgi:hypothetical protein